MILSPNPLSRPVAEYSTNSYNVNNNKNNLNDYRSGSLSLRRERSVFYYIVGSLIIMIIILLLAFTLFAAIKPCLMTKCHKLASKCVNSFPFYAQCLCDPGYAGNGRTHCDVCGLSHVRPNIMRIVGGSFAIPSSWPFAVMIRQTYKGRFKLNGQYYTIKTGWRCGGTLINHMTILTASHCVHDNYFRYKHTDKKVYILKMYWNQWYPNLESTFQVYVGVSDLRYVNYSHKVKVKRILRNDFFDSYNMGNDFALFKVNTLIEPSSNVQFACLPSNISSTYPKPNTNGFIIGWGSIYNKGPLSFNLKNSKVKIFNGSRCMNVGEKMIKNWKSQICAGSLDGSTDSCQGDSGNGLFVNDYLDNPKFGHSKRFIVAGIVSYGEGCALKEKPGVYTRVSYWLDWIKKYSDF